MRASRDRPSAFVAWTRAEDAWLKAIDISPPHLDASKPHQAVMIATVESMNTPTTSIRERCLFFDRFLALASGSGCGGCVAGVSAVIGGSVLDAGRRVVGAIVVEGRPDGQGSSPCYAPARSSVLHRSRGERGLVPGLS